MIQYSHTSDNSRNSDRENSDQSWQSYKNKIEYNFLEKPTANSAIHLLVFVLSDKVSQP